MRGVKGSEEAGEGEGEERNREALTL